MMIHFAPNKNNEKVVEEQAAWRVLSSRCILSMKRLVTLKYKKWKTSKASSENNLEV